MPTFKLYSCKLRLDGSVLNEVPKEDITAAEIEMLRALHGNDAIVDVVETGTTRASDSAERQRIKEMFLSPMDAPPRLRAKTEMFRNLFGHDSLPLPTSLATGSDLDEPDDEPEVVAKPVIKRTRVAKTEPDASFAE